MSGEAMATLTVSRRRELPPLVLAAEPVRLATLIRDWLESCERERPPFRVRDVERTIDAALGGVRLSLRVDRVDALADGGAAILDYKSGETPALRRWFDERPAATQLGLYALAWRDAERDTPLRAVAFAAVTPDGAHVYGIADDARTWPGLAVASELPAAAPRDWPSLAAWWRARMTALAADFAAGEAAVDPRDREVCGRCGMQSLCRVGVDAPGDSDDG
jgi:hypothetical protein